MYSLMVLINQNFLLSAQQNDSTKQLKEVTVTATRTEKDADKVGRSVTVITSDDIKKYSYNSLGELLSAQAGIYLVGSNQNIGGTQSIFMRGANSNQTVIMIDGIRISDPSAVNNSPDLSELSLSNIDRIEIVRGTHSTLFGSSAIGGAVNIITKKTMKNGVNADVSLTYGNFGSKTSLLSENLWIAYKLKNGFYVSAGVFNANITGIDATLDTVTSTTAYKHADMKDGLDKTDINFRVGFTQNKWDIYAGYKMTKQLTDIDKRAYVDDDNYTLDYNRNVITYGGKYMFTEKAALSIYGGMTMMERIAIDDSSVIDNAGNYDKTYNRGDYTGKYMQNGAQFNYKVQELELVIGGEMSSEEMNANTFYYYYNPWAFPTPAYDTILSSNDTIKPRTSTFGAYLRADANGELFSEKLNKINLGVGIRAGNNDIFGTYFTYEINPSIKISNNGLFYLSYGTGYNAPSLYQQFAADKYYTWDFNYTTGLTRGNKLLQPETSQSFEIGVKQNVNDNISFTMSAFKTVTQNNIEYVYLWDKNIGIDTLGQNWSRDDYRGDTYLNLGTMTVNGAELGIVSKVSDKFHVRANFSMVGGEIKYDVTDIDTSQTRGNHIQIFGNGQFLTKEITTYGLTRRPATANMVLTYIACKQFSASAIVRYAGARGDVQYESTLGPYGALATVPVAEYTLVDLSFVFSLGKHFSGVLKAENIFDKEYYEINGFSTRGRSFYLKATYNF
jgi:vitamin B12 transporter